VLSATLEEGLKDYAIGAKIRGLRLKKTMGLPERQDGKDVSYHFESLDYPATERRFNAYYAEFLPVARDEARLHKHAGAEFIYTLKGRLKVPIDGQEHTLEPGDSMYFDSGLSHGAQTRARHTHLVGRGEILSHEHAFDRAARRRTGLSASHSVGLANVDEEYVAAWEGTRQAGR
jgi:mannose-6-phosphate isomerase-like protein (cupin superfamily)